MNTQQRNDMATMSSEGYRLTPILQLPDFALFHAIDLLQMAT